MLWVLRRFIIIFLNMGLMLGLTFGVLMLLRPVTVRLLRPQHRVALWYLGWWSAILINCYDLMGSIRLLPVTFRSLVIPRVGESSGTDGFPFFLPLEVSSGGVGEVVLPGGWSMAVPNYQLWMSAAAILWVVGVAAMAIWHLRRSRQWKKLGRAGELMDRATMAGYGLEESDVAVRLCESLPTSFVRRGHDTGRKDGIRYVICLQKELPPEQMRLVLLHEAEHIRLNHPYFKAIAVMGLTLLFWWNPILWLACRLTCRDMELACDQAVLKKLEPAERRDYARTLVELGSGRHMWGSVTSFGECDAALRVRRAARWKPVREELEALSLLLASVLFVFFFCGGPVYQSWKPAYEPPRWPEYLESGAWMDQVAQKLEQPDWQPKEVWSKRPEALVVLDETGQWYSISFSDWTGEKYDWVSVGPMRQAFLDGYTRVS